MSQISKQISCTDLVPGCAFKATAATEEELLATIEKHARESHGVKEITQELAAKVNSAIKDR